MSGNKATTTKIVLRTDHASAVAFLDETGSIAQDRFFAVGCLILPEPSVLLRAVQKIRDKRHWYDEIKWVDLTMTSLPLYTNIVDAIAQSNARFSCLVADRDVSDPVARFGDEWQAYEKLATQLIVAARKPYELLNVMADNYSTPDAVQFEKELKQDVNQRLKCLAAVTVCRLDSRSCDGLQLVDILTGAVTFEYRQHAGLAGNKSAKALLSDYLRRAYSVDSFMGTCMAGKISVARYDHKQKPTTARVTGTSAAPS